MYLVEKYMTTLKTYVWNMARLEGSMIERYIRDECFGFIIEHLQRFEVVQQHVWDVEEEEGDANEVLGGVGHNFFMTLALHDFAHQYVLSNITLMSPWLE
jgi:hypothetical protein